MSEKDMAGLEITEVQIIPVKPRDGLVAFASCVIDGTLYAGNIAIHTSPSALDGLRLVYPDKVLPNGKVINCFHPITKEAGEVIKKAIVSKYLDICDRRGDSGIRLEPSPRSFCQEVAKKWNERCQEQRNVRKAFRLSESQVDGSGASHPIS